MEWKTVVTKHDNLTDAEKQLIAQQEKVWKALGIWQEILETIPNKFFLNANDLSNTFDKFSRLSKSIKGEIYNYYKQQM